MFLKYDISIVGREKVRAAFNAIESEALASNRRTVAKMGTSSRRIGRTGVSVPAYNSSSDTLAATKAARAAAREERARTAAATREARQRAAAEIALQRQRSAALLAQKREEIREERKAVQSSTALQRQRHSALMAQYRAEEREKRRLARLDAAEQRRTRANMIGATKGVLGGTAARMAAVGRIGVAATGLAGGALIATGVHASMAKNAAAADLANQLLGNDATEESLTAKKGQILSAVGATRGFNAPEVIAGMSKFQGTAGEGAATMKMAPVLTRTSLATGASMENLGDMYASMYAAIRNSAGGSAKSVDQIIDEIEELGRVFGAMGQVGAIEIKDVAAVGSEITAAAMSYHGNIKDNIQKVGAMMQIAKQTGGAGGMGGNEASTAVQNFANDLVKNKDEANKYLKSVGGADASVFSDKSHTKLKSLDVLIPELMAATGGDLEKMSDVLNIRGARGLKGFTEPYREAYDKTIAGGGTKKEAIEAGKKAVSARFNQFSGIQMSKGEVESKANFRLNQADKQFEERMRELTSVVGDRLLPEVIRLIPSLAKLTPYVTAAAETVAKFVRVFAENPMSGLGSIVGLAITAEITKAGLGALLNSALQKAIAAPGAGVGAGGAIGAIAVGVGTFTIASAVLNIMGAARQQEAENAAKSMQQVQMEYFAKKSEIISSEAAPFEKAKQLEDLRSTTTRNIGLAQENTSGMMGALPDWLRQIFDSGTAMAADKSAEEFKAQVFQDMKASIDRLSGAIDRNGGIGVNTSSRPSPVK